MKGISVFKGLTIIILLYKKLIEFHFIAKHMIEQVNANIISIPKRHGKPLHYHNFYINFFLFGGVSITSLMGSTDSNSTWWENIK